MDNSQTSGQGDHPLLDTAFHVARTLYDAGQHDQLYRYANNIAARDWPLFLALNARMAVHIGERLDEIARAHGYARWIW